MKRTQSIALLTTLLLALLAVGGVWAAEAGKAADGRCAAWGAAMHGKGVMGRITAIEGERVTLQPELPDWLASKLAEKGITAPQQPASVSFSVTSDTRIWRAGAQASLADFKVGDLVAARLDADPASSTAIAKRLLDDSTLQSFLGKMKQRRGDRISREGRPVMGTITAIEGQHVTLKPELSPMLRDKLAERGKALPQLPESLSFNVASDATIIRSSSRASLADFSVGEQIVAMVKGDLESGMGEATKLADRETAISLLKQRLGDMKSRLESGEFPSTFSPMGSVTDKAPRGAKTGQGPGKGQGRGKGEGQRGPEGRPVLGKITKIDGDNITVKPLLPEWAKQRAAEEGRELPRLPDSISFRVSADTQYILHGQAATKSDFKVGDEIAAMLDGRPAEGNAVARKLADIESARKALAGGPGKDGQGVGGPQGKGGPPPMFGTITSISSNSITIKPEMPDFAKKMAQGAPGDIDGPRGAEGGPRGKAGQRELPAQITVSITASTKYFQNDSEVKSCPFKAGDKVAIMLEPPVGDRGKAQGKGRGKGKGPAEHSEGKPGPGSEQFKLSARAVTDYATAEARLKQHLNNGKHEKQQKSPDKSRARSGNKAGKAESSVVLAEELSA